jgi:hypothetical protein
VPWHHCPAYYTAEERTSGIGPEGAAWYERERPKYTMQQWAAEYECDFVGSGAAVFGMEHVDAAQEGAWGEREPEEGRAYVTSADIGRRQDATVINTFDITEEPYQRVAHERVERVPYPVIQRMIERRVARYPGTLHVESNGVGDPVIENLLVPATPFVTTTKTKTQAIQSLVLLLEHRRLKAKWTPQERKELMLYQWDDRGLVQDCVMSLAIGATNLERGGLMVSFL